MSRMLFAIMCVIGCSSSSPSSPVGSIDGGPPDALAIVDGPNLPDPPAASEALAPGLAVRDVHVVGDTLYLLALVGGRVRVVSCPLAGCPATPTQIGPPLGSVTSIEIAHGAAYWVADNTLRRLDLTTGAVTDRYDPLGQHLLLGNVVARATDVLVGAYAPAGKTVFPLRVAATGVSKVTALELPAPSSNLAAQLGADATSIAFRHVIGGGPTSVRVLAESTGIVTAAGSATEYWVGRSAPVIAGAALLWSDEVGQQRRLVACARDAGEACTVANHELYAGLGFTFVADPQRVYFPAVYDQQAWILACPIRTDGTRCEPKVIANDLSCWLGARRIELANGYLYGVGQSGALCRVALR